MGNLTDVTDPRSKITHNGYDNRNRKTSTTEAYNTPLAEPRCGITTRPVISIESIVLTAFKRQGLRRAKSNDLAYRPRQVIGGGQVNVTTNITYNPSGTIQKVRDAKGHETNFDYDASDRKIIMTYPGTMEPSSGRMTMRQSQEPDYGQRQEAGFHVR